MWISRKEHEELLQMVQRLNVALAEAMDDNLDKAYLRDIDRKGRITKFTFVRAGETVEVETMSMMSDNLPEWKEKLLR